MAVSHLDEVVSCDWFRFAVVVIVVLVVIVFS